MRHAHQPVCSQVRAKDYMRPVDCHVRNDWRGVQTSVAWYNKTQMECQNRKSQISIEKLPQRSSEPQPNPKNTSQVRSPDFQSDFFIALSDWGGLHNRKAVERNKKSD
jgi:hypothetical protein